MARAPSPDDAGRDRGFARETAERRTIMGERGAACRIRQCPRPRCHAGRSDAVRTALRNSRHLRDHCQFAVPDGCSRLLHLSTEFAVWVSRGTVTGER